MSSLSLLCFRYKQWDRASLSPCKILATYHTYNIPQYAIHVLLLPKMSGRSARYTDQLTNRLSNRQDRQTYRPSNSQTHRPTDRQTHRATAIHTDRWTNTSNNNQTHRSTDRQTNRPSQTNWPNKTDWATDRQTEKNPSKSDRQTDRATDRQTDRLTIEPAGIPDAMSAWPTVASSANLSPVTKSTGRWIWTLFFFALSINPCTIFEPSSSNRESPICHEANECVQVFWLIDCFKSS